LSQAIQADARIVDELRKRQQEIQNLINSEKAVRSRLELFGATDAMGRMLRKKLEAVRSIKRSNYARDNQESMNELTDRQIDIDEKLENLNNIDQYSKQLLAQIPASELEKQEVGKVSAELDRLLATQKKLLESLASVYQQYSNHLLELGSAEAHYAKLSDDFEAFIRGKLFWIRNTSPVNFQHLEDKLKAAKNMLSPTRLRNSLTDIQRGFKANPVIPVSGLLLGIILILFQPLANSRIAALGQSASHLRTNRYYHTLQAIYYTVVRSSGWAVLLGFSGWWLGRIASSEPYTTALSEGLYTAATVLFTVSFWRQLCRPDGLAHRHFHWPNNIRRKLWVELRWLKYATAPLSFLIAFTLAVEFTPLIPAIGRPALVTMMIALMIFSWRMLNASSPITAYLQLKLPRNWLTHTRFIWFPLLMLTPLSLAMLSIMGYHYTAGLITQRLLYTIWLLTALLLAKDLFLRWIFIEKRRIAWQEAVKRREARRAEQTDASTEECDSEIMQLEEQDSVEFYEHISDQAQHIISAILMIGGIIGFWMIWSDLLPALKFLDNVQLPFTTTELVDGIPTDVHITLADVGVGTLVAAVTIMAAKNIPGLLEILLLQRLPIDAGARYAITTLSQYLIVAVGIIAAFSILGTQWSSIQWLVAALSVGLGFGLQEIVANFVSGIIILFERPIRVGDIVTVGDTTGTVSRIQIRATTIRNWDRQELLVPNKEFITSRLLNWTLTDPINRITIDIGIAYGTDVNLALKLLAEAASEQERILDDPEPLITFEQFGDSSLNLKMRCYLDSMEFRTRTRSELNELVNRKFAEAGIPIPFPQRDVHLNTAEPLSIRIEQPDQHDVHKNRKDKPE
ncbi:MAG TPA: mechanosensitive ion channel, partial [Gammaproteobacteria bacterium]|nr:mechanosensitive ion channel [Gammaproteobacteria bacterium]